MKVSYSGKRPSQSERRGMRKSLRKQTCCSAPAGGAGDQCLGARAHRELYPQTLSRAGVEGTLETLAPNPSAVTLVCLCPEL